LDGEAAGDRAAEPLQLAELRRKVDNLQAALVSQRLIGIAIGLTADRHGTSTDEGWQLLARLSQDTNVKVRDIAQVLTASYDGAQPLPDPDLLATLCERLPHGPWTRQGRQIERSEEPPGAHRCREAEREPARADRHE
jgi:hypothetical protein